MRSQFDEVHEEAGKVKRMIFGFIDYLRDHKTHSTMNLEPRTSNRAKVLRCESS